MSNGATAPPAGRPWHLWLVGILGLLWNLMGAYDYLMTQTQNEAYMSQFTPEQLEYFYGFPSWAVAFWAVAVWGGVLGTILLLLKKRLAVPVFMVSFLSMVVTSVYNFILSDGLEMMGGVGPLLFSALVFLVALGLWIYSRAMAKRGVLV
jgi:hypothetical protein